eukprot:TRINITY_DN21956_c0_g1_i2.p1 TRINITY_DN21956_c0_g1~~TRINITY_DN21956_c0_g1_i2.p1  ORF type:complete len:110 (+),score=11.55 TRINITY_DN21956_c0_g1_i2:390-719(+)
MAVTSCPGSQSSPAALQGGSNLSQLKPSASDSSSSISKPSALIELEGEPAVPLWKSKSSSFEASLSASTSNPTLPGGSISKASVFSNYAGNWLATTDIQKHRSLKMILL